MYVPVRCWRKVSELKISNGVIYVTSITSTIVSSYNYFSIDLNKVIYGRIHIETTLFNNFPRRSFPYVEARKIRVIFLPFLILESKDKNRIK